MAEENDLKMELMFVFLVFLKEIRKTLRSVISEAVMAVVEGGGGGDAAAAAKWERREAVVGNYVKRILIPFQYFYRILIIFRRSPSSAFSVALIFALPLL